MMYDGMMGGFGFVFIFVYLGVVVYFFYLLTSIAKSVRQIADKVDKLLPSDSEREKTE